jgi:hypothetical protein
MRGLKLRGVAATIAVTVTAVVGWAASSDAA